MFNGSATRRFRVRVRDGAALVADRRCANERLPACFGGPRVTGSAVAGLLRSARL